MLVWTRKSGQSVTIAIGDASVDVVAMISPSGVHCLTTTRLRGDIAITKHSLDRLTVKSRERSVTITTRKRSESYSAVTFDDPTHSFSIRPTERLHDEKMKAKGYTHHLTIPGIEPLYVKSIAQGSELMRVNYPRVEGFSFRRITGKRD
jgi:hypothetical protein